jgi:hypothetical protein
MASWALPVIGVLNPALGFAMGVGRGIGRAGSSMGRAGSSMGRAGCACRGKGFRKRHHRLRKLRRWRGRGVGGSSITPLIQTQFVQTGGFPFSVNGLTGVA